MAVSNPREPWLLSLMQENVDETQIALDNIINCLLVMRTEQNQKNKIIIFWDE